MQNYYLNKGIYLIVRPGEVIREHYGVLDVGNNFGLPLPDLRTPVVIDLMPPRVRCEWLKASDGWKIILDVPPHQIAQAVERRRIAMANPEYHATRNNCEHFARYIVEGKRYSIQLQNSVIFTTLCVLAFSNTRR